MKDISISEMEQFSRYHLIYNYNKPNLYDVILWGDNIQRMTKAYESKNLDSKETENKCPYGLACNISAF